ncbi:Glycine betaine transporter [wastewater metagenome]|uniref:Glycine betaine transporter n=2 Tax=unclassified sequences TaxID=12908 RepID=A0A5B8RG36_9ZZZZ|nr:BCCT family transporter [Arhodomonas sp. KWT]QEA06818.1 glycine betaine transporter [uncultured organism]
MGPGKGKAAGLRYPRHKPIQWGPFRGLNPVVTTASSVLIGVWLALGAFWTETADRVLAAAHATVGPTLEWYYVVLVTFLLAVIVWLGMGRYQDVRLGQEDERPEFGFPSWIAMLFAAGTGVGLIFWSIAEPVAHFQGNPFNLASGTPEAAATAMRLTFFHWGLHGWAVFAAVALALAYFRYRKGLPLTIRSTLYPLIGRRIYGWPGDLADTLAVFGTVFGVATTLGLGAAQMNTGLDRLTGFGVSLDHQLVIIAVVTGLATLSVVSGVRRGVRLLSIGNLWLSLALLGFFLVYGPTTYLFRFLAQNTGSYLQHLVEMSFWTNATGDSGWQQEWTVFYWGWWLAWSPFVGMFIARISRGRTLREFVFGVLLVPTLFSFVWIGLFGGTALHSELYGPGGITAAVNVDVTLALYQTIDGMRGASLTNVAAAIATLLIATYFITSADSGTLVINTILAEGDSDPPTAPRVIWGLGVGVLTGVLLTGGGVPTLQSAVVMAGLPFSVVVLVMVLGLIAALQTEESGPRPARKARLSREPWTGRDRLD